MHSTKICVRIKAVTLNPGTNEASICKELTKLIIYISVITYVFRKGYIQKTVQFTTNQVHERIENRKYFEMGKEKYFNFNKRTKLKDFSDILSPISIKIEKEEPIHFKIPKASSMVQTGIGIVVNKIKNSQNIRKVSIKIALIDIERYLEKPIPSNDKRGN